jgi:hypothetical protein
MHESGPSPVEAVPSRTTGVPSVAALGAVQVAFDGVVGVGVGVGVGLGDGAAATRMPLSRPSDAVPTPTGELGESAKPE